MPDALARLRRLLPSVPKGAALEHFLPETTANELDQGLERRAALASTLLAGLELEREGSVALAQDKPFGGIRVAPPHRPSPDGRRGPHRV